ncbi:hypothetical protein LCGC14_2694480, partial [marine sediment metagenome]
MNPELAVLYAKLDIYGEALQTIKHESGAVCPNFMTCTCPPCRASYGSWALASEAIEKATKLSQSASQPEKPMSVCTKDEPD